MYLLSAAVTPLLLAASVSARFVMYADEWHPSRPDNAEDRAGIDTVVVAFAKSNDTAAYQPKVPISTWRSEYPNAKIMVAIGGWGDTTGFSEAVKSDSGIKQFATDAKTMLTSLDIDGIDIDWEYPGGNGADYKETSNEAKANEVTAFPKLLSAIRDAIGKDKLLSIAVPGTADDMIGYTKESGEAIWPSIDYINVMAYDLMNRRDSVTSHHTSVEGAAKSIQNYLDIGAPAEKLNLGFAYYAKYFTTQDGCTSLGCPIVAAEDASGTDTLTSGAWTFEKANLASPDISTLAVSTDGTCGADKGTKCASGCCSQYGSCGTTAEFCSGACQHAFGTGCTGPDIAGSWQKAAKEGVADDKAGGQYYFDTENKLFWTWDSPEFISRKFTDVVKKLNVGGVMAWSLGEDSYDWSHVKQMAKELEGGGFSTTPSTNSTTGETPVSSSAAVSSAAVEPTVPEATPAVNAEVKVEPETPAQVTSSAVKPVGGDATGCAASATATVTATVSVTVTAPATGATIQARSAKWRKSSWWVV